jgi:hypothetical protein
LNLEHQTFCHLKMQTSEPWPLDLNLEPPIPDSMKCLRVHPRFIVQGLWFTWLYHKVGPPSTQTKLHTLASACGSLIKWRQPLICNKKCMERGPLQPHSMWAQRRKLSMNSILLFCIMYLWVESNIVQAIPPVLKRLLLPSIIVSWASFAMKFIPRSVVFPIHFSMTRGDE